MENHQKEWIKFALEWGWILDFDSNVSKKKIFIDLSNRKITTSSTNLTKDLAEIILGVECGHPANRLSSYSSQI